MEFNAWVDEKLATRNKLMTFLNSRKSTIPEAMRKHNSWGMFDPDYNKKMSKDALEVKD